MQDKHRPCQDGMFSDTASKRKIVPTLSRAQRWMSVQQYACNYTESCHNKQGCVTMNSSVRKRSLDFLDLCSTVLQDKNKTRVSRGNVIKTHSDVAAQKRRHSRGDIIKSRSDVSHLRGQLVVFHNDRRTWERARSYSSIHRYGENLVCT